MRPPSPAGIAVVSLVAIVLPALRRGRFSGRGLMVGGMFDLAHLAIVIVALAAS